MRELTNEEVEHHVAAIERDGFSIMEDAIAPEFLTELELELERLQEVRPGGDIPPAPFTGFVTRRWFDVLNDAEVWQRVATHPWIMQIMPKVLGEGFLLSTMGSAVVGPGEEAQPIHVDDGVYMFPRPHPNLVCNTMWALSDFTEETGATRVVPGSNNLPEDPVFLQEYESIPMEMPTGSIAFVLGTCYHGAGANKSDADRVALTINYCNGSMRQQENLMLGIHPARMMTFPLELQDILGFKLCKAAGHIFAQDPRLEMQRHYGSLPDDDPYQDTRNELHSERVPPTLGAK
ncbi:MAG: phytanoyl-CoA dioxygenase family protein [Pseudomonadales bacterium]|jgi:ectoine hydroxylase-related dioxygenase (phytanoyl-CoA dioxygenase family)|nr:phytanoyl-CoA dioxygenase family protein [Kiritimatiellia bacterium]MDP6972223.1 phytanoyl-CoA dioxygenase family protein [Pseudomonadales bacterium]